MYTSYSTLQRKQLSKQAYTDTQSTYLLVYAPGRHKALETALQNQLHRKFRLVTALEGELTPDVAGVLLVSEDVECIPTALTYFAAALREGADLAVCDASFGFDGSTALYLSTRHLPGNSCAMVSRDCWTRCAPPPGAGTALPSAAPVPRHGAAQLLHPAGAAALPPGAVRRGRILRQGTPRADPEPRADHDRRAHRAGKRRAGAAQPWL